MHHTSYRIQSGLLSHYQLLTTMMTILGYASNLPFFYQVFNLGIPKFVYYEYGSHYSHLSSHSSTT